MHSYGRSQADASLPKVDTQALSSRPIFLKSRSHSELYGGLLKRLKTGDDARLQ